MLVAAMKLEPLGDHERLGFKVARSLLVEVNENINLGYSQDQGYS